MKRNVFITALLGLAMTLLGGVDSLAAKEEAGTKLKVAVVDFQRAINETKEGKQAEKSFQLEVEERKKKFEILKGELDKMKAELEKNRLVMSEQELNTKGKAFQQKAMEAEQTGANYEQELAKKKADALRGILTGLQSVVQDIGGKEKFDFIFEKSQGGVLFATGAVDITEQVIKQYDSKPHK